jgi:hypothetical protein
MPSGTRPSKDCYHENTHNRAAQLPCCTLRIDLSIPEQRQRDHARLAFSKNLSNVARLIRDRSVETCSLTRIVRERQTGAAKCAHRARARRLDAAVERCDRGATRYRDLARVARRRGTRSTQRLAPSRPTRNRDAPCVPDARCREVGPRASGASDRARSTASSSRSRLRRD